MTDIHNIDKVIGTIRALKEMALAAKENPDRISPGIMQFTLAMEKWVDLILEDPDENIPAFMTTATYIMAVNPDLLETLTLQLITYGPILNNLISAYKELR